MAPGEVRVLEPGLLTTIQDAAGRPGLGRFGIPRGGAMDARAARLANRLVGDDGNEAVLELTRQLGIEDGERRLFRAYCGQCFVATGGDDDVQLQATKRRRREMPQELAVVRDEDLGHVLGQITTGPRGG